MPLINPDPVFQQVLRQAVDMEGQYETDTRAGALQLVSAYRALYLDRVASSRRPGKLQEGLLRSRMNLGGLEGVCVDYEVDEDEGFPIVQRVWLFDQDVTPLLPWLDTSFLESEISMDMQEEEEAA